RPPLGSQARSNGYPCRPNCAGQQLNEVGSYTVIQKLPAMCEVAHTSPGIGNPTLSTAPGSYGLGAFGVYGGCCVENKSMEPQRAEGGTRPALARGEPPA